jgi:hypothetical protein
MPEREDDQVSNPPCPEAPEPTLGAARERFDNNRTDPRSRPNHSEPSPEVKPRPNPEYSRNDYNEDVGDLAPDPKPKPKAGAGSGCADADEHGNCYRAGCPVHDS